MTVTRDSDARLGWVGHVCLRNVLMFVLTFTAGVTDAIGFIALGEAFTSVMTGNIVLLGIALADHDATTALRIGTAIVGYLLGCVVGTRITGRAKAGQQTWPGTVTLALVVEFTALTAGCVVWWASSSHPQGVAQVSILGIDALALGVQGGCVLRFGDSGLSTTYMTGKLTKVVAWVATGGAMRDVARNVGVLCSLAAGAVVSAFVVGHAANWVPVIQLAPLAVVIGVATFMTRKTGLGFGS